VVATAGWERILELIILGMLISLGVLMLFMIVQKLRIEHVRRREERVARELMRVLADGARAKVPTLNPAAAPDRRALARALAVHRDTAAVTALLEAYPHLLEQLQREARHVRWGRRAAAIEGLGLLHKESLRGFFLERLANDPDARVRATVLESLARLVRRPEDLEQLASVMPGVPGLAAGFHEAVLVRALQSLDAAGAPSADIFAGFIEKLPAADPLLRVALAAAGRTGQRRYVPLIAARTLDPALPLASHLSGLRALGRLQPDHPALLSVLKSGPAESRLVAARVIRESSSATLAALRDALADQNFHVRRNAARTLFDLGEAGSAALRATGEGQDAYAADMSRYVLARETPR
jgi:hypothetical protein